MDEIEKMTRAIMDMATHYGLGSLESRAIITALEHGRIAAGVTQPDPLPEATLDRFKVADLIEIRSKDRVRHGRHYPGQASGMFAQVTKDSIRITGTYYDKPVDITFKVGDVAEYDSYNLRYLGEILKITKKRITIRPRYGSRTRSMDLYGFAWRNHNFNLEQANAENAETSMYI